MDELRVRCIAYDSDGAYGAAEGQASVAANPDLAAAVDDVFLRGGNVGRTAVYPAALRRLQQLDAQRHAAGRRRGLTAAAGTGAELKRGLDKLAGLLKKSASPSPVSRCRLTSG